MTIAAKNLTRAYRWQITGRVLLAAVGGYLLSTLLALLLSYILPGNQAEASYGGAMISFLIWLGIILWVFASQQVARAALSMLCAFALGAGIVLVIEWSSL